MFWLSPCLFAFKIAIRACVCVYLWVVFVYRCVACHLFGGFAILVVKVRLHTHVYLTTGSSWHQCVEEFAHTHTHAFQCWNVSSCPYMRGLLEPVFNVAEKFCCASTMQQSNKIKYALYFRKGSQSNWQCKKRNELTKIIQLLAF